MAESGSGYLQRILANGAMAFRYRSGVRRLLGISDFDRPFILPASQKVAGLASMSLANYSLPREVHVEHSGEIPEHKPGRTHLSSETPAKPNALPTASEPSKPLRTPADLTSPVPRVPAQPSTSGSVKPVSVAQERLPVASYDRRELPPIGVHETSERSYSEIPGVSRFRHLPVQAHKETLSSTPAEREPSSPAAQQIGRSSPAATRYQTASETGPISGEMASSFHPGSTTVEATESRQPIPPVLVKTDPQPLPVEWGTAAAQIAPKKDPRPGRRRQATSVESQREPGRVRALPPQAAKPKPPTEQAESSVAKDETVRPAGPAPRVEPVILRRPIRRPAHTPAFWDRNYLGHIPLGFLK